MSADDLSLKYVFTLLDAVNGPPDPAVEKQAERRRFLQRQGFLTPDVSGIKTKGCPDCKGTMYHIEDKSGGAWVCSKCGRVE